MSGTCQRRAAGLRLQDIVRAHLNVWRVWEWDVDTLLETAAQRLVDVAKDILPELALRQARATILDDVEEAFPGAEVSVSFKVAMKSGYIHYASHQIRSFQ